ncbi:hypothetical protein J3459_009777 [Metarhizium acridum]|nr:hypothetical protein J3459_009777 [Metarhizium acridum]
MRLALGHEVGLIEAIEMNLRLRALAGISKAQVRLGNGADGLAEQGIADVRNEGLGEALTLNSNGFISGQTICG